ncbi:IS110 family transposase [Neorhodopirellula pilleata]|uniref:Transposase IS116/IS110/IS902 family protein n=1 Tax=Neorhodopirellula pilleata TaxID=2714738 RepID=A0A5C5YR14_9BACT|nr:transposase [Neorhodopirellula pilleata]TWT77187.1 Transposase IS116/IS110/IS902 family protein [Neorhodopirellula pilleata]
MTTLSPTQTRANSKPPKHRKRKNQQTLQKPNGVIAPRVKAAGADHFAVVCIDPAKLRSELMMADYFGNLLIEPCTVEHEAHALHSAIQQVKQACQQHAIKDMIVTIERTGNYHRVTQKTFAAAGFEVRLVHPFATKQYRLPADPGNKTDATDLFAQHRAAVAGFGLCEFELPEVYQQLRLRVRHRRDLVEKATALACQIREHLHLSMPRYPNLFSNFFSHAAAMEVARTASSPAKIIEMGTTGLRTHLSKKKIRFKTATLEKIVAWANQAAKLELPSKHSLIHSIWTDLHDLHTSIQTQIVRLESEIAGDLAQTPYVRLLAIPGVNVVSAADFAGEMGPIEHYANANAITGRSGLFPSRYQSDQTDNAGRIVRSANRRLRASLMRIADNLANLNAYFRIQAAEDHVRKIDKRATRVKIASRFSRIAYACVAGNAPLKHACCRDSNSIIEKLRMFHHDHGTSIATALVDLENAVVQLPYNTRGMEADAISIVLQKQSRSRRSPTKLGEILPSVLAKLSVPKDACPNEESTASD